MSSSLPVIANFFMRIIYTLVPRYLVQNSHFLGGFGGHVYGGLHLVSWACVSRAGLTFPVARVARHLKQVGV